MLADAGDEKAATGATTTPPMPAWRLPGPTPGALLAGLVDDFFVARRLLKGSPIPKPPTAPTSRGAPPTCPSALAPPPPSSAFAG
jgi:hypothetical protein